MSGVQRIHKSSLGVLIDVIKSKPKADRDVQISIFEKRINRNHIREIVREWVSIKYTTARDAAIPLSEEEIEKRRKEREKDRQETADKLTNKIRMRALWSLIMPNGKPVHECTFGYVAKINPLFKSITMLGKGQMKRRIDTVYASAEELEIAAKKQKG